MKINRNTKISTLIHENHAVIEAMVSLNQQFEKLRNPLLRRILAPRVTISNASKIAGTDIEKIFEKLTSLGFCVEEAVNGEKSNAEIPEFYKTMTKDQIIELDVRDDISNGNDPFKRIIDKVKEIPSGKILKLINTFEPAPLINILSKKGYACYVVTEAPCLVNTYIMLQKSGDSDPKQEFHNSSQKEEIGRLIDSYGEKIIHLDVREMEAPMPMITILEQVELMQPDHLLKVQHSRVPFLLLPELDKKGFDYKYQKVSEDEIMIIIFKNGVN
jgi:TusA-related sulfurtransferase